MIVEPSNAALTTPVDKNNKIFKYKLGFLCEDLLTTR